MPSFLVRYDCAGTRYEDTLLVRAVDLADMESPATEEPAVIETTENAEDTEPTEAAEEESEDPDNALIIGSVAALVVVIALVTVLCLRKSKKPISKEAPAAEPVFDPSETEPIVFEPDSVDFRLQPSDPTKPVEGAVLVSLVALLHPDITCSFPLVEGVETTLGRDNRSAIVLNASDRKLSGLHAAFLWDGTHLLVRDKRSTNGTFVNGTPCASEAWYLMENGATVQLGGYEYRVSYHKNAASGL